MNGADVIAIIILAAIVIAVLAYLLHWLYRRSTKDVSFVRTGFGGEKIVMGGGAFVLPILHDITEVNMNTLRLEAIRAREKSLITQDRMRVEMTVEFYVRVAATQKAVSTAARSLGRRTMDPDQLRELVLGRFVDGMGAAASEMTIEEIQENRRDFARHVRAEIAESLEQDGLELESVSVTSLDQADISMFNPSNTFDSEGLTRLVEQIEARKKRRNDIEKDTDIAIRAKNLEAEKKALDIGRDTEYARMLNDSEISVERAQRRAEVAREEAGREREIEQIRIAERELVERARIISATQIEAMEIQRRQQIELDEESREIALSQKAKERSEIQTLTEEAVAAATEARERVLTIRDIEIANRHKSVELIEAAKEAERDATRITILAKAEEMAATSRAAAVRIAASAEEERLRVQAEGAVKLNEAENLRSDASRKSALHQRLVENLPAIIRESVKPMEKISEIKILHVDGLPGFSSGSGGGAGAEKGEGGNPSKDGNLADQVVESALRYRSQAPFVDQLLGEIGMDGGNIHRSESLRDLSNIVYSEPGSPRDAKQKAKPDTAKPRK